MKFFVNRNPGTLERIGMPFPTASSALAQKTNNIQTYLESTDYKPLPVTKRNGELFIVFTDYDNNECLQPINEKGEYINL